MWAFQFLFIFRAFSTHRLPLGLFFVLLFITRSGRIKTDREGETRRLFRPGGFRWGTYSTVLVSMGGASPRRALPRRGQCRARAATILVGTVQYVLVRANEDAHKVVKC